MMNRRSEMELRRSKETNPRPDIKSDVKRAGFVAFALLLEMKTSSVIEEDNNRLPG